MDATVSGPEPNLPPVLMEANFFAFEGDVHHCVAIGQSLTYLGSHYIAMKGPYTSISRSTSPFNLRMDVEKWMVVSFTKRQGNGVVSAHVGRVAWR